MTVQAGERLGLFARTGQLSLKSGEGAVDVQAQNGSMRLFAEKKLTLSSASDISFAGKKRITLIGGGCIKTSQVHCGGRYLPELSDEGGNEWRHLCCKGWGMNSVSFSLAAQHLICSTKVTLFALVDGLQYERYFGESLSVQQPAAVPLFDTRPDSRIAFAGPWVMEMNSIMDFRERLCELEAALPSVSWMISSSSLTELAAHFRRNMNTELPDGRIALLRFHDPRVRSAWEKC